MSSEALAIMALALSAVTFGLGYRASRAAERRSHIPVLVFVYDPSFGWSLRNVGNGPALNVLVAQKYVAGEHAGAWYRPVRVPPIARDAQVGLPWLGPESDYGLGAVYEDFLGADERGRGRTYTVTCGNDLNAVAPGRTLPRWRGQEILKHWEATAPP